MIKINTYPPLKKINIDSFGKMAVLSRESGFTPFFAVRRSKDRKKTAVARG